jgi:AAA+ ATPase superfamily predicted ATPase
MPKEFVLKQLTGRQLETEILQGITAQALSGEADSIILTGTRGIGKTELLRHLYENLFSSGEGIIPFFYAVRQGVDSVEKFTEDYLAELVLQMLSFISKNASLMHREVYSLEELKDIAKKADASWCSEIVGNYFNIREGGDRRKLFSFSISVPYQVYHNTGMPVAVLIDDFHRIEKLCETGSDEQGRAMWTLFEKSFKFGFTPHVLSGVRADMYRMFFEDTSLGEYIEMMDLKGLKRSDALELFRGLCMKYSITYEEEAKNYIHHLGGNPFYITSFMQAVRQSTKHLTEDKAGTIYISEVTGGKISAYWTSILKACITTVELRKSSLQMLFYLSGGSSYDLVDLSEKLSLNRGSDADLLGLLHGAGIVETGFSALEFSDDQVLTDVIRGLYYREIEKEGPAEIREVLLENKQLEEKSAKTPSFHVTIPAAPKAELVAVKSLEQAARHFKLPSETIGKLQVALVELISVLYGKDGPSGEDYKFTFTLKDNVFSLAVVTAQPDLVLTDEESRLVLSYIDDISVEEEADGSKITLIKEVNGSSTAS